MLDNFFATLNEILFPTVIWKRVVVTLMHTILCAPIPAYGYVQTHIRLSGNLDVAVVFA